MIIDPNEKKLLPKIPIRQDITVLPEVDPKLKLGWVIEEVCGREIYHFSSEIKSVQEIEKLKPITERDGIKDGDKVFAWCLWGWVPVTVCVREDGSCFGETADNTYPFDFDKDSRHCWSCWGQISKGGIKYLEIKDD